MGVAVLLFGLVVGIFHFQDDASNSNVAALSTETGQPVDYSASSPVTVPVAATTESFAAEAGPAAAAGAELYPQLADAQDTVELAQAVADMVAASPGDAAVILAEALGRKLEGRTLGDVATLAAAATRSAPGEARAIAGALARTLAGRGDPVLAASIATVVSLVPEQARDIGLVVGAILGEDLESLAMVGQTVAIATGEDSFSGLAEASGVSLATIMSRSSRLGVDVPFNVPAYAAQHAPSASMVAEGTETLSTDNDL